MNSVKWLLDRKFPSDPTKGLIGSVNFNIWVAQFSGVPLNGLRGETRWVQLLALFHGFPILIGILIYVICELYDLMLNLHNLDIVTQNICLTLPHMTGLYKVMNILVYYSDIKHIIEKLRSITKRYVISKNQKKVFDDLEFGSKLPLIYFASLVTGTSILAIAMLLSDPATVMGKVFPFRVHLPVWLPIEVRLTYMSLVVWLSAIQIVAMDYLNINLINQLCLQLKILNLTFDELTAIGLSAVAPSTNPNLVLKSAIEHHCELRHLEASIDRVFSTPVLVQFASSLIMSALTGFQAIVAPSGTNTIIYLYCGCIFCELFLYCWFGNEVHEQSKTLASSGYSSDWHQFDKNFKKSLVIFINNAQKPFLFTAGGFMGLTLPSFAGILSKSYSFIAVLRQVYSK